MSSRPDADWSWDTIPNTDDLLATIASQSAWEQSWLGACRELCQAQLPEQMFEQVPSQVWDHFPMYKRLVIKRVPPASSIGRIVVPDLAQKMNSIGWVLTVGPEVNEPDPRFPWWPGHPLTMCGRLFVFAKWAGANLAVSTLEKGDAVTNYVTCNVADLWGPLYNLPEEEWKGTLPS